MRILYFFFFFFFFFQVLEKNNVLPAGMNLFGTFEREACQESRTERGGRRPILSTRVLIYHGGARCEGYWGERIRGDQIIFPFVSEGKKERK